MLRHAVKSVSAVLGHSEASDLQVKLVSTPERSLAISMPNNSPDVTIDRDAALLLGGARSPTSGSMSCGVTVVIAVMKEMAVKAPRSFVTQTPILYRIYISKVTFSEYLSHTYHIVAVKKTSNRTNGLRGKRSPRGHRNKRPAAYPACITVGICETFSYGTSNSSARMFKIG
jgi:hypothetical protein